MRTTLTLEEDVAKLIERINTSKTVPVADEIAKTFYGFESVEEFDANWKAFIESRAFSNRPRH